MQKNPFRRTKLACYSAYFTMSSIFSLPPLLFVTFHDLYGISYTLLGTLVLINFVTQMSIDLIFTVGAKKFDPRKIIRVTPLITTLGLLLYALIPSLFPDFAFVGLVVGTVIFSVASGLSEVMLSPTIAAIPSDTPQRDMSMLHSLYAFGVFFVVIVTTVFLKLFGNENWMYLTVFFALLPVIASVMFMVAPMPDLQAGETAVSGAKARTRTVGLCLCALCIFLGSSAENTMSNWVSGYIENALNIDKALGDMLGLAMFAILLGLVRICYAKFGKHIGYVLLVGMIGAVACYLTVGLTSNSIVALIACALTGVFTSMLWPGTLILMEENIPHAGVAAFALMASSGDMGAAVAPQLMGYVIDSVSASKFAADLGESLSLTAEQVGMKTGMLVTSLFPLLGAILMIYVLHFFKKHKQ